MAKLDIFVSYYLTFVPKFAINTKVNLIELIMKYLILDMFSLIW